MEQKVVLKNNEQHREIIDRIKLAIMQKVIYEKRVQDASNPTRLGNCSFWFQKQIETEIPYLIFTTDPALWDVDAIKEDLDNLEHYIYKQSVY